MKVKCVRNITLSAVAEIFTRGEQYDIPKAIFEQYEDYFVKQGVKPTNKKVLIEEDK